MTTCECGHYEHAHYTKSGRCAGNKGRCGCVLWKPTDTFLLAANLFAVGCLLWGMVFLTAFMQAVLVGVVLYAGLDTWRKYQEDRVYWAGVRQYLNREDWR